MSELDFNPNAEPSQAFEPIPPGKYAAIIREADVKDTKNGDGKYLWLKWQLVDDPYSNRFVFANITMKNNSQQAVDIGAQQFAALWRAIGLASQPAETSALNDGQCVLELKVKAATEKFNATNEVRAYLSFDAASASAAAATAAAPAAAAPAPAATKPAPVQSRPVAAAGTPPWKRK